MRGWPQRAVVVLALLSAVGCLGSMPPRPPLFEVPGVKTDLAGFRKETITSLAGSPLASRIMQIRRDADGALIVLAENGIRWVGGRDQDQREIVFETRMFRHTLVPLADGRLGIGGFSSRPNAVVILDLQGRELLRISTGSDYEFPIFVDVTAGPGLDMLVPHNRGIRVLDMGGQTLTTVASRGYVTIKTVVQADEDERYEIAFVKTSLREGPIEALIMNADGSVVSEWKDTDGGWLSFVPDVDDTKLWGITSEGFTAWDAQGKRVTTFPAPDADYLRFVIGTKVVGHTALIGSGGGYSNLSLLCVFDEQQRLVYEEVLPFRTYAIFADPNASDFFVGAGHDVVRYSLLPRRATSVGPRPGTRQR